MESPEQNIRSLNLYQKIVKVMEKVSYIEKGANVSTGAGSAGYKAIQHDDVTALLHPRCADLGIVVIPSITSATVSEIKKITEYNGKQDTKISYRADVWVDVMFINADDPKEQIVTKTFSYAMDSSDKATGKAYSMAVKYAYLKTFMLQSGDDEESRDYENRSNNNSNQNRNSGQNQNRNNSRNISGNNGGNQTANNKGTNHVNSNNSGSSNAGNSKDVSGQTQNNQGQQASQASDNQIRAIKNLCEKKGIEIGEKFKVKENCSSQEASSEIARINAIKG
jgi:hypothetical protein